MSGNTQFPVLSPGDFTVRKMARQLSSATGDLASIAGKDSRHNFAVRMDLESSNPTLWPKAMVMEYVASQDAHLLKSFVHKKSAHKLTAAMKAGGFRIDHGDEDAPLPTQAEAGAKRLDGKADSKMEEAQAQVEDEGPKEPPLSQMVALATEVHKGVHGTAMIDEACEISTRRKIVWSSLCLSLQRMALPYDESCDVAFRHTVLDAVLPEHQVLMAELYQNHMGRDPRKRSAVEKRWATRVRDEISKKLGGEIVHNVGPVALAAIRAGIPLWLGGPRGGGKSFLASQLCAFEGMDRPVPVQGSNQVTVEDVIGAMGARSGSTVWEDGSFTSAWRAGAPVVIDEFSAWNGDIHLELHGVLNGDGDLFVRATSEVVRGDSPVIVTDNSIGLGEADAYIGTQVVNAATRDRFAFVTVGAMDPKVELEAVRQALEARASKLQWTYSK